MTVHMIRVYSEPPNNSNHFTKMQTACEDWVSRYSETLTTERLTLTHIIPGDGDTRPEHTMGHWRFDWAEDQQLLLDDLETDLQAEVSWYRIKYHNCSHDNVDNRGGCSWDETETREFGTVPAGIP